MGRKRNYFKKASLRVAAKKIGAKRKKTKSFEKKVTAIAKKAVVKVAEQKILKQLTYVNRTLANPLMSYYLGAETGHRNINNPIMNSTTMVIGDKDHNRDGDKIFIQGFRIVGTLEFPSKPKYSLPLPEYFRVHMELIKCDNKLKKLTDLYIVDDYQDYDAVLARRSYPNTSTETDNRADQYTKVWSYDFHHKLKSNQVTLGTLPVQNYCQQTWPNPLRYFNFYIPINKVQEYTDHQVPGVALMFKKGYWLRVWAHCSNQQQANVTGSPYWNYADSNTGSGDVAHHPKISLGTYTYFKDV